MKTKETPKKLVVGLDDSHYAPAVADVAVELAERLGLSLRVVHSADQDIFVVGERRRTLLSRGEELLDELIPAGTQHERIVDLGEPGHLVTAALDDDTALAVVGSRGRGAVRTATFGSTSKAVVNAAPTPVVVVPPNSEGVLTQGPAAVVAGVDGSPGAFDALVTAADLARRLGSELVAVHVDPGPIPLTGSAAGMPVWPPIASDQVRRAGRAIVERAIEELDTGLPVRIRCEIGDPAERLSAVASEQPSAILVVGSRGYGPLRSALVGSVSSRLAASAPVPVVVVPHGARRVPLEDAPVAVTSATA